MSCDQALDKLPEKVFSRLLVQEEHCFQKGHNVPPWLQELQKSLAWIGLNFLEYYDIESLEGHPSESFSQVETPEKQ